MSTPILPRTPQADYQSVDVCDDRVAPSSSRGRSFAAAVVAVCGLVVFATSTGLSPATPRPNTEIVSQLSAFMGQTRPASSNVHAANPKALKVNKQLRNVAAGTLAGIVAAGSTVAPVQAIEAPVVQARVGGTIGHLAAQDAPPVVELPKDGDWKYSDFVAGVLGKKIQKVEFEATGAAINAFGTEGQKGHVNLPNDRDLIDILINNNVDIFVQDPNSGLSGFLNLLSNLAIPLIFLGGLLVINRSRGGMSGPAGGPMQMGKAKDKFQEIPETGVTFADVAGVDGAKLELKEVVDFLKSPEKYTNLGAKIPKGALLAGPPGTGKTLLAKAVAGEAGVPFFSTSASEFVELFVGVGASRVRDLFTRAKEKAPCIVFIDEIDAVGRQRGAGMGGGNDEREQTINQLLTEMDGFEGNSGVIVLAATNRPDVLDNALLRPGRFDRQITVDRPDVKGRVKILEVHSKGKALASDVDLDLIARRCPGFTGADLQNLMNEAAILTARRGLKETGATEIADALEKIVAGAEKSGAVISAEKKKLVAYHEAGHALVGALMPEYDPVAKISILPRGGAGGLTFFAPSEERLESGLYSRSYLENQMAVALGGRIAEELIWGENGITTGASNDFQQVSRTARMMVTQMGYSDKLGQVAVSQGGGPSFLGQQAGQPSPMSQLTADIVDSEVKNLVEIAYRRAKDCMQTNISILHKLAEVLLEKETIDGDECAKIIKEAGGEMYLKEDAPGVTIPYAAKV